MMAEHCQFVFLYVLKYNSRDVQKIKTNASSRLTQAFVQSVLEPIKIKTELIKRRIFSL